ncbi:InlB B-repeat-containing protein [Bifidobacterium catenulatum subsp. kashiwanohense]|uniref:InlB B-repeat-containing protein n=1 Tax=Bifidobacterium catenulatum subsp. kashiwanohense TaxID=630129 RepID=A0AAJ1PCR5_9BIFI|nr:InlB B-repeat-containing protein [Bifidobacterium catenulatum]MDH7900635.1 InlB B-repeat-containing protein [Bifidobacterium catenulatum subsp. kashiwanohense]
MGFLTRLIAGFVAASTLGAGLAGTANAVDAAGAASDTTGAVTTTADDTGGRTVLDCRQSGEGATGPYADKFCWIDWSNLPLDSSGKPTPVRINVPGGHIDADATITHTDNAALTAKDYTGSKWSRLTSAYKLTGNTALAFSGRMGRQDPAASVTFSNVTPSADRTDTGVNVLKDFQLAFGDAEVMSGGVLQGHDVYERTDIESDKTLEKLGMIGSGDPNQSYSKANTGYGTTHVTLAGGPKGATDDANKDSKGAAVVGAKQASRFKVSFGQVNQHWDGWGSAIAVGVYMPYLTAYPLTYDKNSSDASGQVPSNQRGQENTTQPAKTKTNGKIRLASDTSKLSDHLINSDFEYLPDGGWKTNGTVKTVAEENAQYGSLANGDFSYPSFSDIQKNEQEGYADLRTFIKSDDGTLWYNMSNTDLSKYGKIGQIPGFDSSRFAWSSTENGSRVELQQDRNTKNTYAEIVAQQDNTSIYQNVSTGNGGVLYKIRLKHASRQSSHADRMQVLVGADAAHATPVEMTRVTSNGHGDKVGGKSTTITTKVSNTDPRDHGAQWETYEGYYQVPEGQKNTVFMFKSLEGFKEYETLLGNNIGNLVDDIEFSRSYKLTYDKNSDYATGSVPSDTTANTVKQAKTSTTGTLRLASDDDVATYAASNLPEQIVNGGFDYPSVPSWTALPESGSNKYNKGKLFATINPGTGKYGSGCAMSTTGRAIPNWNRLNFAWNSTQGATHYSGGMSCEAGNVELNYDSVHHNQFAELTADQQGTAIYQDVKVTPGTMMKWSLKHSSATSAYVDKMQVMIGEPYKETAQEATRITSENGNKVGEKMTTISTPTTSDRADNKKWDTYSGTYLVPDGVTTVRFTFKSVASAEWYSGNDLDDIEFSRSYKLSYDKNASNATGSVPSNQRGKENTVQPAASKTNGTVKTVADDTSNLSDHLVNGDFEYPGANVLSKNRYDEKDYNWWGVSRKDKMVYDPSHETQWVSLPSTFDSDRFAWDSTEVAGTQNGSSQWHTNEVELQRDSRTGNMYGELCAYQANTSIRQYIRTTPGVLYKVRLKHASLSRDYLDKMQVLIGPDGNEQPVSMTRVESQNGLDATGESTASTTVSTHVSNEMEIKDGQGTPYSSRNHDGQWATYEGVYVATSDVTSFTFKSIDAKAYNLGNLLDDIVFDKAYRLSYDKNATDANGSVPSDETAGATKQAKASTTGTLRLASDDGVAAYAASNLPKQLVNSDFDHDWQNIVSQSKMTDKYNFANVDPAHGDVEISGALNGKGEASKHWVHLNGFDTAKFGWKSNQTDTRVDGRGGIVEIQRSKANDNMYAEITASQANTYLYQDIDTAHSTPTVYTVKLRYSHRDGTVDSNEKIQILVGAPGHEQPVEMTRIASDRGNKVGEKSTTVNAPNTDGWLGSWDTFQGSVEIPAGQPVSRFTFKALGSVDGVTGNLIDDVQFKLAYPLSYDKNAQDATGSVPSSQYGKENTVKPAKAKTTGTVKTVADGDSSKSLTVNPGFDVPDYSKLDDGGLHWMYVSPAEGEAWSFYDYINPAQPRHQVAGLSQATFGWQELTGGDYKTTLFELHREKDGNVCADVHGSRTIGQTIDTQAGVAYTVSIRHSGRSKGNAGSVQVLVGPDKDHLRPLEMSRMNVSRTGAKYGDRIGKVGTVITTHSDSVDSTEGDHPAWDHSDDWETYSGTYVATGGKTVFAYRGVDKNGNAVSGNDSGADSVIDDLSFKLAYPLAYDKNAQDATGSVPSDMAANTTQPAKSETDGKVSDLVQRTTTHEDGSVTVRTVDQSTDVVSGCQVYYPAGQRITLATLAKDGDCWDSSMLTRPGHTQLGWSQDSQATQAQAEVTMVEGGMTVYAVWVGNPVLTYDTNKPNTWNGQMPSTPASVSVPYDTAAADGSGWQSGDTSKIRGYRFLGWYAGPQDDAGLYDWNTLLTGNVTVYAHWQRLQANVVYDANGGTGSHGTTTGWQYSDVTVPSDTSKSFTRAGYVFLGWDTQADGNGTAYKDGSQVPLQDKDITLYAQWQPVFEQFTPTGGVSLPLLVAGGVTLLVMGIGSTVMLTRRMRGEQ